MENIVNIAKMILILMIIGLLTMVISQLDIAYKTQVCAIEEPSPVCTLSKEESLSYTFLQ